MDKEPKKGQADAWSFASKLEYLERELFERVSLELRDLKGEPQNLKAAMETVVQLREVFNESELRRVQAQAGRLQQRQDEPQRVENGATGTGKDDG